MKVYSTILIRLLLVTSSLALVACGDNTLAALTETHSDQADNTESAITTQSRSKAKDTPEVRNMLAAFAKQAHRIELNGCEMLYNGKPFELGMTIAELEKKLGSHDVFHRGYYIWKDIGVVFSTNKKRIGKPFGLNNPSFSMSLYLNNADKKEYAENLKHMSYIKEDYFLIEGVPVDRRMKVKDFFSSSSYKISDFSKSNYSYDLKRKCMASERNIEYLIFSDGVWVYKGGGHLSIKSHPNEDNENTIKNIFIDYVAD